MARRKVTDVERKLMKDIAKNLRSILTRKGWSQKELAEESKLSTSVVSDYLHEKTLATPGSLQAMADALGVRKSEIDPTFAGSIEHSDMVLLPVVGQVSCGNGTLVFEEIEGYEATPKDWLNGGEYFYLKAKGDSMTGARIQDGDLLLIRRQEEVENGEIAAVLIGEEAVLKRVYINGDQLVLQSENPAYGPIFVPPAEARIIGKLKMVTIKY